MSMFTNTKIFLRLSALVVVLLAFTAGVSMIGLLALGDVRASLKTVYEDRAVPLVQLAEMVDLLNDMRQANSTLATNTQGSAKAEAEATIAASSREVEELWKAYMATYLTPEEKKLAATAEKNKADYYKLTNELVAAARRGTLDAAVADAKAATERGFAEVNKSFDDLKDLQADVAKEEFEKGNSEYESSFTLIVIAAAAALAIGGILAFLIARSVTEPLTQIIGVMNQLTSGNLSAEVRGRERGDELGEVARAVGIFKDGLVETERLKSEQQKIKERAEADRKVAMQKMADDFENAVGGIVKTVASAATELQASAESLSTTAQETSSQATTVASASTQVSANIQTVSAAAEELATSVQEIRRQIGDATSMTSAAVTEASRTDSQVQALATAAQKINDVVELINNIASQTNLLALNATIEAARAGDAGKGFAVVASEVKNLATQTAKATGDIGQQIGEIQATTQNCVNAIKGISATIGKISAVANAIATAVEEQSSATSEIARNVNQASQGSDGVSQNIVSVNQASEMTGSSASEVLSAARELSTQSEKLNSELSRFLETVRKG
jgi:methyl-accepting chemotaxis protein